MPYLIAFDYLKSIQDVNLSQIITNNTQVRLGAEQAAQAEAISFLKQKYDTTKEFSETILWDKANIYKAADRVYLNASAYVNATSYVIDNLTLVSGNIYICIADTTGAFDATKWMLLGAQYAIFSAVYPEPLFDIYANYVVGDKVFWNNKKYTALVDTQTLGHDEAIQFNQTVNLPYQNVFPDDKINGLNHWGIDGSYSVPVDTLITNATYWAARDNRDLQMVEKLIDITLYHLHQRIAPLNIPALRQVRYFGNAEDRSITDRGAVIYPIYSALGWLQGCARGEVTPNLPKIQPKKGSRIRYGGQVRNVNSY